jgi:hypothetical protein
VVSISQNLAYYTWLLNISTFGFVRHIFPPLMHILNVFLCNCFISYAVFCCCEIFLILIVFLNNIERIRSSEHGLLLQFLE